MQNSQPTIVLASGSPRRRELLETLGIAFEVDVSQVDESLSHTIGPARVVETLASRKAQAVAQRRGASENSLIVGSDTVVVCDGYILGKPHSREHAVETLLRLQGRTHQVYTGLCVVRTADQKMVLGHSRTEVHMRPLTKEEIERYVATGEPMDKAGAYAIQGRGATIVTKIVGDYFTVVGLPLQLLAEYLRRFDVEVW